MLENAQIIALQLIKMFIFIAIGFLLFKGKLITEKSSLALVNVLIYAIIPCVILDPLIGERTGDSIRIFLISLGAGGLALLASLLIAWIFFRKNPIEHYGAAFSNAGFMGFPLIVAVLGEAGTIYITGFFLLHSIGQWVYNILLMKPKVEKPNIKGLFLSPIMISLAVGLIIFLVGIRVPGVARECVSSLADCNSPIAMIILGTYLGKTKLREIFTIPRLYLNSAVRLIIIPAVTALVLCVVPRELMDVRTAIFIAAAAPVAVNTAVYAQKGGQDYTYAVKSVCLSTLLSLVLFPLMVLCAGFIWGV